MSAPEIGREIVILDARAARASVRVVSQASVADLARPTPCADWRLAELLAHMTAQHNGFAAAAAGDGGDLVHWQTGAPVADPVGEYAAAAERVIAAFAAAVVPAREFVLPEISPELRFPAVVAIGFHFVDYVVHGWDVARTLGRDYDLEPDVLAAAVAIARAVPDGERRRAARGSVRAPGRRDQRRRAGPDCRTARSTARLAEVRPELPLSHGR